MFAFMSGAIALACMVIGLFFWKFYKRLDDRFFLFFSISFQLLALERLILTAYHFAHENEPLIYLIRFMAFLIIIVAIIDKNRTAA